MQCSSCYGKMSEKTIGGLGREGLQDQRDSVNDPKRAKALSPTGARAEARNAWIVGSPSSTRGAHGKLELYQILVVTLHIKCAGMAALVMAA